MSITANFIIIIIIETILGLLSVRPSESVKINSLKTKYDVQLEVLQFYNISSDVFQNLNVRVKKFNRTTFVVDGSFEIMDRLDMRYSAIWEVYTASGNEYKLVMPPKIFENFCFGLAAETRVYPHIVAKSNFQKQGDCPFRPNKFWIKNYAGDISDLPELPSNAEKWKLVMNVYRNNQVVGTGAAYALIKPRK